MGLEESFTNNNEVLIRFENLTKYYGDFCSVSNLNMDIRKGEIIGLLGPNGAGKTTTMKMMAHILKASSGAIWYKKDGEFYRLTSRTKDYLLKNVGFLVENPALYTNVTPRQLLTYIAKLKGYPGTKINQRIEFIINMIKMDEWIDKKIGTFSKGMKEKIGILSAIVHDPEIIILDEPQTGLDPKARVEIRNFILQLKQMGKTVFFSSHLLYEVSEVADKVVIISNGQLIAYDTMENLEARVKSSLIHVQVLNSSNGKIPSILADLTSALKPAIDEGIMSDKITYVPESRTFDITFDGETTHQFKILKLLVSNGIEVVEYSVPKAGLLERLYMTLTSEPTNQQEPMSTPWQNNSNPTIETNF